MATFPHEYQYNLKDLTLISHTGKEISLYPQFVEFTFEETIFGTTLHGTIFVVESIDLPTMLPMIGEEKIKISFTRLDENTGDELDPISFEMPIYSLYGKKQDGKSGKRQTYNLAYCSNAVYKNLNAVVSKSFKNMPYSDIVKNIYETYLQEDNKPIEVESTKNAMNYVVQNQRPIKAIKTICKRSTSNEGNGSFYVFFEDRDKFNFVTMRKLMKQDPIRTFYQGTKNMPTAGEGPLARAFKNLSQDMYNASTVKEESGFDILSSAMKGEGASSILTVDPIRRNFSFKTFDLRGQPQEQSNTQTGEQSPVQSIIDGITKLIGSPAPLEFITGSDFASIVGEKASKSFTNNNKMFVNPRTNLKVVIGDSGQDTQEYIAQKDPSVRPYAPEEFLNQREAEKASFLKHVISASLPGDPTIKVGSVVKFDIPEKTGRVSDQNPEELDKYLQGNYIVVSVAHIVTKDSYKMNVELMKNSPENDINPRDLFSEYGIRTDE